MEGKYKSLRRGLAGVLLGAAVAAGGLGVSANSAYGQSQLDMLSNGLKDQAMRTPAGQQGVFSAANIMQRANMAGAMADDERQDEILNAVQNQNRQPNQQGQNPAQNNSAYHNPNSHFTPEQENAFAENNRSVDYVQKMIRDRQVRLENTLMNADDRCKKKIGGSITYSTYAYRPFFGRSKTLYVKHTPEYLDWLKKNNPREHNELMQFIEKYGGEMLENEKRGIPIWNSIGHQEIWNLDYYKTAKQEFENEHKEDVQLVRQIIARKKAETLRTETDSRLTVIEKGERPYAKDVLSAEDRIVDIGRSENGSQRAILRNKNLGDYVVDKDIELKAKISDADALQGTPMNGFDMYRNDGYGFYMVRKSPD